MKEKQRRRRFRWSILDGNRGVRRYWEQGKWTNIVERPKKEYWKNTEGRREYYFMPSTFHLVKETSALLTMCNVYKVIELQLPSFFNNFDPSVAAALFPSSVQAYLAGLTFALAASPCSTPVLATLLGYVAASKDPVVGGSLLLTYTTGYVAPLLLAASFAGALQSLLSIRKFSAWINPISGALLFGGGVFTLLDKLFPVTMTM